MRTVARGLLLVGVLAGAAVFLATTPDQIGAGPAQLSDGIYDPVRMGEELPDGFRQLLPRDAIFPVYAPTFRREDSTDWPAEALVIGVELDGEAKAYPVTFLNRREMVVDWIGGSPVLVSW